MEARIRFVRDGKLPVMIQLPMTTNGVPILPSNGDRVIFDFKIYIVREILWTYDGTHTVLVTAKALDDLYSAVPLTGNTIGG